MAPENKANLVQTNFKPDLLSMFHLDGLFGQPRESSIFAQVFLAKKDLECVTPANVVQCCLEDLVSTLGLLCLCSTESVPKPLVLEYTCMLSTLTIEVILSSRGGHQTLLVTWLCAGWTCIQSRLCLDSTLVDSHGQARPDPSHTKTGEIIKTPLSQCPPCGQGHMTSLHCRIWTFGKCNNPPFMRIHRRIRVMVSSMLFWGSKPSLSPFIRRAEGHKGLGMWNVLCRICGRLVAPLASRGRVR